MQNPSFRESKRKRMEHEYESEREPRSILQEARTSGDDLDLIVFFRPHSPTFLVRPAWRRQRKRAAALAPATMSPT